MSSSNLYLKRASSGKSNVQAPRTNLSSPPGASMTPSRDTNSVTTILRDMWGSSLLVVGGASTPTTNEPGRNRHCQQRRSGGSCADDHVATAGGRRAAAGDLVPDVRRLRVLDRPAAGVAGGLCGRDRDGARRSP